MTTAVEVNPGDVVRVEMEAGWDKDTPKKHRYTGDNMAGIQVAIYLDKRAPVPDEILITLNP